MGIYVENLDKQYPDYIVLIQPGNKMDSTATPYGDYFQAVTGIIQTQSLVIGSSVNLVDNLGSFIPSVGQGVATGLASTIGTMAEKSAKALFASLIQTGKEWGGTVAPFSFSLTYNVFYNSAAPDGFGTPGITNNWGTYLFNLLKLTGISTKDATDTMLNYYTPRTAWNAIERALDYKGSHSADWENQLFIVSIGNWFRCRHLIPISSNLELSTSIGQDGQPLYGTVTVSFEYWRDQNVTEMAAMLGKF